MVSAAGPSGAAESPAVSPTRVPQQPRSRVASILVPIAFAVFTAYDLWEAIGTALVLPEAYRQAGFDPAAIPWWVIGPYIAVPVVCFVLALLVGRRQRLLGRTLILLVGLAVSAALSLGFIALHQAVFFSSL